MKMMIGRNSRDVKYVSEKLIRLHHGVPGGKCPLEIVYFPF